MASKRPRLVFVTGSTGSGKSSFVKEWIAEDPDSRVQVWGFEDMDDMFARGYAVIMDDPFRDIDVEVVQCFPVGDDEFGEVVV